MKLFYNIIRLHEFLPRLLELSKSSKKICEVSVLKVSVITEKPRGVFAKFPFFSFPFLLPLPEGRERVAAVPPPLSLLASRDKDSETPSASRPLPPLLSRSSSLPLSRGTLTLAPFGRRWPAQIIVVSGLPSSSWSFHELRLNLIFLPAEGIDPQRSSPGESSPSPRAPTAAVEKARVAVQRPPASPNPSSSSWWATGPPGPVLPLPLALVRAGAVVRHRSPLTVVAGHAPVTQKERRRHSLVRLGRARPTRGLARARSRSSVERMVDLATVGQANVTLMSARFY